MRQIVVLNDIAKQNFKVSIANYDFVDVTLEFSRSQYSWYMSIKWGDAFEVNNDRVACSPNLLRQYRDIIPFGFLIRGPDSIDPFAIDAWMNGWGIYILDETDLIDVESLLYE